MRGGDHGPGGGPGGMFGESSARRYSLTLSASARNLFDTVNLAAPVGNLSSPLFGQPNAIAGGFGGSAGADRRVEFQARFSF